MRLRFTRIFLPAIRIVCCVKVRLVLTAYNKEIIMKKTIVLIALLILLSLNGACSHWQGTSTESEGLKDAGHRRYQIESGVVQYQMTGGQNGSETIYFDRWGMREAKYTRTEISFSGITQKTNTLTLIDGEWIYVVDMDKRTAAKTKNSLLKTIAEKSGKKDFGEIGEQMLRDMGGEKIGSGEIAGKPCDVWEVKRLGSKSWVWKSIALKTQVKMGGLEITSTATSVEEGVSIPEDKFALPSGVSVTETQDINKTLEDIRGKTRK